MVQTIKPCTNHAKKKTPADLALRPDTQGSIFHTILKLAECFIFYPSHRFIYVQY